MTNEQVELGARALFEHERQTPLGRFVFPGSWAEVPPVERYRFMEQARVVLRAAEASAASPSPPQSIRAV